MRVLAVTEVDLTCGPQGLAPGLAEDLGGKPVLRRTVENLSGIEGLVGVEVITTSRADHTACCDILSGLDCRVTLDETPDLPHRDVLRRSRLWARNSWRGGIGGTTVFDEAGAPARLLAAGMRRDPEVLVHVPAESPLIEPGQVSGIVRQFAQNVDKTSFCFADLPPGLNAALYTAKLLDQLTKLRLTPYAFLRYRPEAPQRDSAELDACFHGDDRLRMLPFRMTSDSRRCLERLRAACQNGVDAWHAAELLRTTPGLWAGRVPEEMEIQVAAPAQPEDPDRDCFASMTRFMDEATFAALARAASVYDDVNLTLGGPGDPLAHPELPRFLAMVRGSGIHGLAITTTARLLTPENMDLLISADVDAVSVLMGGGDELSHKEMFGVEGYDRAATCIRDFIRQRKARGRATPFVLPIFVKTRKTVARMEQWYDQWHAQSDWPVIRGWNDYAGQRADESVLHPTLGIRIPCKTLFGRMHVAVDGRVTACGQDFSFAHALADLGRRSVEEVWNGPELSGLRADHVAGNFQSFPLCRNCKDWYHL